MHVCDFTTVADVRFEGWRFDFSERFGPLLLHRVTGEPLAVQPTEQHPFWVSFKRWLHLYRASRSESVVEGAPQKGANQV